MIFSRVLGHKKIIDRLKEALQGESRKPTAFLFCGPSGVGKKLIALGWAQGLLCHARDAKPCGKCSACQRVEKLSHPDLLLIESEATLKIEQIRDVQKFVSLRSFENRAKVIIINEAQMMTPQSGNALLKTLEEPPAHSYFVLITSNRAAILPTIQSRCQRVLFGSLTPGEVKKIMPNAEEWALNMSQGRADLVARFTDEDHRKLRQQALRVLEDLPQTRLYEGFSQMKALTEDRNVALFAAQCWEQTLKSALSAKLGANINMAPDEKKAVSNLSKLNLDTLFDLSEKVLQLEQDIVANVNKNLAFEKFFIDAKGSSERRTP